MINSLKFVNCSRYPSGALYFSFRGKHIWPVGGENKPVVRAQYEIPQRYKYEENKNEWRSAFTLFKPREGFGVNFILKVQRLDFRLKQLQIVWKQGSRRYLEDTQRFQFLRLKTLGWDLQTAHFLLAHGGRIKFKDSDKWLKGYKQSNLPRKFVPHVFVEAIDVSSTLILYEGLENMENLKYLKYASFSNCVYFDDFCIDRICGMFYDTIEFLDISFSKKVTERGLIALSRLRKLRYLNLTGLEHVENFDAVCFLLEDETPGLYIEGSPHIQLASKPEIYLA